MPRADLHTHTTASDGRLSPPGLVEKAALRGLAALSITDHDTLAAYPTARLAAERHGLELVPGVELSVRAEGRDVHLLGYGFDLEHEGLRAHLARYRAERQRRAEEIVARLGMLGVPVSLGHVLALAEGGAVGRPHVARALLEAGHVGSVQEAFARFLGEGGPAAVPKGAATPEEAITLLHEAGGVCVLAHPGTSITPKVLAHLLEAGLDGIEVVHPVHDEALEAYWRDVARRHGLLETGGSDYHGFREEEEARFGTYTVPAGVVPRLRRAA